MESTNLLTVDRDKFKELHHDSQYLDELIVQVNRIAVDLPDPQKNELISIATSFHNHNCVELHDWARSVLEE